MCPSSDGASAGLQGCATHWNTSQTVSQAILLTHLQGYMTHWADAAGDGGEGGGLGRGVPGCLEHLLAAALAALQRAVVQQRAQDALHLPRAQLQPRHPLRRQHSDLERRGKPAALSNPNIQTPSTAPNHARVRKGCVQQQLKQPAAPVISASAPAYVGRSPWDTRSTGGGGHSALAVRGRRQGEHDIEQGGADGQHNSSQSRQG